MSQKEYDVVHSTWFTNTTGMVGIVTVRTVDGLKSYIGVAQGKSKYEDEQWIAALGSRFYDA